MKNKILYRVACFLLLGQGALHTSSKEYASANIRKANYPYISESEEGDLIRYWGRLYGARKHNLTYDLVDKVSEEDRYVLHNYYDHNCSLIRALRRISKNREEQEAFNRLQEQAELKKQEALIDNYTQQMLDEARADSYVRVSKLPKNNKKTMSESSRNTSFAGYSDTSQPSLSRSQAMVDFSSFDEGD